MACCGSSVESKSAGSARSGCILCRIWEVLTREKTPEGDPCVIIPGRIARKPDPCIYDQFLLMQLNQPVTWDSPDVRIFLNGVEQYTYDLTVGTEYDVQIEVHNSSRDEPAVGTTVDVRWIEFGAGGQVRHPIAALVASVPIWPGTAIVATKWRTPDVPGHYCIEVELTHPDDGNPSNNLGWNNTQLYAAHSSVVQKIPVFNRYPDGCPPVQEGGGPWLRPHRVFFGWGVLGLVAGLLYRGEVPVGESAAVHALRAMAVGYVVLSLIGLVAESAVAWIRRDRAAQRGVAARVAKPSCNLVQITVDSYEFVDGSGKSFDPKTAFKGKGPVWPATVTPQTFLFVSGEAMREVDFRVDAPDTPGLTGRFNVNVWQGGVPSGGVTVTVNTEGP
jgi:hypothetical protein